MRSSGGRFATASARGVVAAIGIGMLATACSAAEPASSGQVGDQRAATQRSAVVSTERNATGEPDRAPDGQAQGRQSRAAPGRDSGREPRGDVVVLDPGHNGGNGANLDRIERQVPNGRGARKQCNSTGTSTADGYPEHAFNLAVAQQVRRQLADRGVRVVLTRSADDGVGPCVDQRAAIGNRNDADAVVSIHADGSAAEANGFHVIYSDPPLNDAQRTAAPRLARAMVAGMASTGLPKADYIASTDGLDGRADLAGLNLSTVPAVLVECGNMRNPDEAAAMSTAEGHRQYAEAITRGVLRYLDR
ncbi:MULTISPECIES: N-acetylmuramoyl-L-alanine amidase [Prauserella salsuginis group]|uniref:N-acetylmuramoyl-L-alanine amidase n=2 Tax=Prauserella salsuginis group TaxID=2893672 RepID=A0A839XNZ7_9PSEU|nr:MULTISPECIES: N-acetylmuramoyl-L-alanine amidase [Prauserella salsuginis group]MBB3663214.1 N-acetylmuramoyl-L-alanine amidase [Prauserella sediminis]